MNSNKECAEYIYEFLAGRNDKHTKVPATLNSFIRNSKNGGKIYMSFRPVQLKSLVYTLRTFHSFNNLGILESMTELYSELIEFVERAGDISLIIFCLSHTPNKPNQQLNIFLNSLEVSIKVNTKDIDGGLNTNNYKYNFFKVINFVNVEFKPLKRMGMPLYNIEF